MSAISDSFSKYLGRFFESFSLASVISPAGDFWGPEPIPLKLKKASKEGEVYVMPGVLEFKSNVDEEDKIEIFRDKPQ